MTMFLLGMNILIIMCVWHFVAKKTLLDHTRDKLFDLRDEVRHIHLERDWAIDSELYGNLRSMINAYLRYTEHFSVWQVLALRTELGKTSQARLRQYLAAGAKANFKAGSKEQQDYVASVRRRASEALTDFAVYNSGLLLMMTMLVTPIFMASSMVDLCKKGASSLGNAVKHDFFHMGHSISAAWEKSTQYVASRFVDQQSLYVAATRDSRVFA